MLIRIALCLLAACAMDRTARADAMRRPALPESRTEFSMVDAVKQNSLGMSEGAPAGVPTSYNWFRGWNPDGMRAAPPDFSAVTGWGQVYQQRGAVLTAPEARVEVADARTYVLRKSTGAWALVQDQRTTPIAGGHFVTDFKDNIGHPMIVTTGPDGVASFAVPPSGYNDHFWPSTRGTYDIGDADAVYVQMDLRVTDPEVNLVAMVGADWWRDATADYLGDHSNNPGAGSSNWIKLSTTWRTLAFYSSATVFRQRPPPPLVSTEPRR